MAKYQLPPLKDEKLFEEFVCDLFNAIENTSYHLNTDFQLFGTKGQSQKGIDIISMEAKTVIQCKLKDIRKKDDTIRKNLIEDIESDIAKFKESNIPIEKFIIASTYKDDAILQEFVITLKDENKFGFNLYYWGWDTLSRYAEQNDNILKQYFPNLIPKQPKVIKPKLELPESALGRDLLKKNYVNYLIKRYGDWKQIDLNKTGEKFNWASFNKHLMNRYKAPGINYIHINQFDDLINYLKGRIDKTILGRNNKSAGKRNYSEYGENIEGMQIE